MAKSPKKPPTLQVVGTPPPVCHRDFDDFASEALALLEVTQEQLDGVPKIEHMFRGIGGTPKVFEYLEGSEEPEARALLSFRARLTERHIAAVPFEAFCIAAGVTTKRMFGIISQEVMDQGEKMTKLLAKASHPQVVQATINNALMPFGEADRKMLHQNAGFVPVPRTSVTHFHGDVDARTQTQNIAVLPPVEDSVKRLNDRFNEQMKTVEMPLLEMSRSEPESIDDTV